MTGRGGRDRLRRAPGMRCAHHRFVRTGSRPPRSRGGPVHRPRECGDRRRDFPPELSTSYAAQEHAPPERLGVDIPADGDSGCAVAVRLDLPAPDRVRRVAVIGAGSIGEDALLRVVLLHLRPALPAGSHRLDLDDPLRVALHDVRALDDVGDDRVPFREPIDIGEEREDVVCPLGHTLCDAPGPPHRTLMISRSVWPANADGSYADSSANCSSCASKPGCSASIPSMTRSATRTTSHRSTRSSSMGRARAYARTYSR